MSEGEAPPPPSSPEAEAKPAEAKPAEAKLDGDAILPATYSEKDLRAAVGAAPRKTGHAEPSDDLEPRSFKTIAVIAGALAVGIAIVIFVVLGRANTDKYALRCEAERVVAQQGRAFPPWGFRALDGEAWQPLRIAHETRCQSRETDDVRALERWMLAMILEEVNVQLAAHDPTRLDETEALLKQCLLLTRPPTTPEPETLTADRVAQHKEVERLLGDVTYWRAAAKLRDAASALTDASKQFDSAAAQRPRHATDAAAWAAYTRKLAEQLRAGPAAGAPTLP
ncbi:MAG TPA: hypothetical protein VFP84_19235, partial [Kofleriaceae bacterium]|nr:hypothetical protein [Kofleriaceae bacterium]